MRAEEPSITRLVPVIDLCTERFVLWRAGGMEDNSKEINHAKFIATPLIQGSSRDVTVPSLPTPISVPIIPFSLLLFKEIQARLTSTSKTGKFASQRGSSLYKGISNNIH